MTSTERPMEGDISPDAVTPDLPQHLLPGVPVPDTAMATGNDEGAPGERADIDPDDEVAAAVEDDAPLPAGSPGASEGGPQDDGLSPQFREPPD